jgi:hypothetical protein
MVASGAVERADRARTTVKWVEIELLWTRAVYAAARQHVGRRYSRDRNERLEANPEFPWRFS